MKLRRDAWQRIFKVVWAAPCSMVGLVLAAVAWTAGAKMKRVGGALEVTYRNDLSRCGARARKLPFRGLVIGQVILAVTAEEMEKIRPHERVHVAQYERWGLLFFLAYPLSSLWQLLRGRRPYWDNHFEMQARSQAANAGNTSCPPVGSAWGTPAHTARFNDERPIRQATMNIFSKIKNAIFGASATASTAPTPTNPMPQGSTASVSPIQPPASPPVAAPATVDVAVVLEQLAQKQNQKLNWRTSIVDLMKLVGLDSSLENRRELAKELGYTGDYGDSATMNIWLHKQVMKELAAHGGTVPEELKH